MPTPPRVEWVRISGARRLAYGAGAALLLILFAVIAWLDLQVGRTGVIEWP